ncbi:MAG: hypothetical protein AAF489_11410 [Bacteroidota bacterium]
MKKIILIAFLLFLVKMEAQENGTSSNVSTKKVFKSNSSEYFGPSFKINATYGVTTPLGEYQSYSKRSLVSTTSGFTPGFTQKISGRYQFNLDAIYQMQALGAGVSFGLFSHEVSDFNFETAFQQQLNGGGIDGTYFGIGPEYTTSIGMLQFTAAVRGGLLNYSMSEFMASYNGTDVLDPIPVFSSAINPGSKSSLVFASAGIKMNYPIYKGLHLLARADYFSTFGAGIEIRDTYARVFDFDSNGTITAGDIDISVNSENILTEVRRIKPQMLNLGIGLQYSFGGLRRKFNPNDISNRDHIGGLYEKEAILAYETSGHQISIEQAEKMYNNYNTIIKPPIEELQRNRHNDTTYQVTDYAFVSIKDLKHYIALLEKVEKLNPYQPKVSGIVISFGAYDMDYDPNDASDQVEIVGGDDNEDDDDEAFIGRPDKYGIYGGRLTTMLAPTYYDDDPKLAGKDEIFRHRAFYIAKDPNGNNKYTGTYVPVPFLNFVDNAQVGGVNKFTRQFFGGSEFGGPRQEMDLELPLLPIDGENTTLFFNDLNNMPPKGNNN